MKRRLEYLFILVLVMVSMMINSATAGAATPEIKKSRVIYTLKDVNGEKYKIYIIGTNEKNKIATWDDVWAAVSYKDVLYTGNYKIYTQKVGSKKIIDTGFQYKEYMYNVTKKTIYSLPSKYKGQPDILSIAEREASIYESTDMFIIYKGKLKMVRHDFGYYLRPMSIGKNSFQTADYDNVDLLWTINNFSYNSSKATLIRTKSKSFPYNDKADVNRYIKNWKKSWM
ncbi:hypothetical protein LRR81_01370 [Metabacillus sp. GX 13764]|uniref:hypothetical protein n=1 Tax=Metabacillus kandeliae TaxID=2900151 RepID=UPI001E328E98|nr:hypothetical protein [Metabacillus kandeliae]MCD7032860.1 hypothetical protein [Metabacillus kandeliae]